MRDQVAEQTNGNSEQIEALKDAVDKEKQQSDKLVKKIAATQVITIIKFFHINIISYLISHYYKINEMRYFSEIQNLFGND